MTSHQPRPIVDLASAAAYLEGLINRERQPDFAYARLDLRPIEALLDRLGRPERDLSVVHVAGSKGKGSTCLFAESILRAAGERVGCFTSPHLESWVERFRIDGRPVDAARLARAVERIRPVVDALRAGPPETVPSFFDATTAVAFLLFAEAAVDRALVEVGLGGRLDSTNVVDPVVTCITSIELEHTDKLGDTRAAIAGEKAGILKAGRPAVLGRLGPDAARVIRGRAAAQGAPVRALGEHFAVEETSAPVPDGRRTCRYREPASGAVAFEVSFELGAPGDAALRNAGLAIACVRALGAHEPGSLRAAIREGLGRCVLPARIEILPHDDRVIVDAAHTAESARALADVLASLAPAGVDLLLSVSSDKNLDALLDALLPVTRRVWVTRADPDRSMPADVLAKRVVERAPSLAVESVARPEEAVRRARTELEPGMRLCAAGSIYLAGIVRRVLAREGASR
jgi:dihydrofolate synthase/folylpolyglutamate synthase